MKTKYWSIISRLPYFENKSGLNEMYRATYLGGIQSIRSKSWRNLKPQNSNRNTLQVRISGRLLCVNRLVYEMFHGLIKEGMVIDHINGNRLDNGIENLREITPDENRIAFRKKPSNKTSKYRGVHKNNRGKWIAQGRENGSIKYIGSFLDEKQAAVAWNEFAKQNKYKQEALNTI